jgi:chemotaxis protein MotB
MRLDDGSLDQRLALDLTPLIDIIFLLVLFFAVSTSFISGTDLKQLQTDVVQFDSERKDLTVTVRKQTEEIENLGARYQGLQTDFTRMFEDKSREIQKLAEKLEETDGKAAKLEFMRAALENQKVELETRLSDRESKNQSLESQLENAYEDFQNLNAELTASKSEAEKRAEQERLLRSLLLEREAAQEALSGKNATLLQQMRTLKVLLQDRESETATLKTAQLEASSKSENLESELQQAAASLAQLSEKMLAQEAALQSSRDQVEASAAQEILLQKLLADKAAELDGMTVRLEAAGSTEATLKQELSQAKQHEATAADLAKESRGLRTQVLRLQAELNKFREVAELDREQIERILKAQEQLEEGLGEYLEDQQLGLKREQQRLTLQLSDKILFASGSTTIKREGLDVLRNLGKIIKERMSRLQIQIGGHTDNIPVRGRAGPLADNWGLSAARAVTVVRFFETDVGINAKRMAAVGYGEHRPVTSNESRAGRGQNRRIEIVLLPR